MIEMLIATVILSVGLLSLAGLVSKMDLTTHDSRYMNTAALLCSEKLEQLSGLDPGSEEIRISEGHSAGSLTKDVSDVLDTKIVSYYDQVIISAANGSIRETKVDANGKYMTILQDPNGEAKQETKTTPPPADEGTVTFRRRWLIEDSIDPTEKIPKQVRRITVRVEYPAGTRIAKYQMTMVRNAQQ